MYSDLYVLYLVFNNDFTHPKNGWVGKTTDTVAQNLYIVRKDDTKERLEAIKSFYSKRSAHQFCKDVERCIQLAHPDKNIDVHVQTKLLPVANDYLIGTQQ